MSSVPRSVVNVLELKIQPTGRMRDEQTIPEGADKEKDLVLGESACPAESARELVEDGHEKLHDENAGPGRKGWLDVLGAVLVNSICYGMTNSFGTFQQYYLTHQLSTSTPTQVSWIGSIQLCLCPLLGCISGPLFDSGHLKPLLLTGSTVYVFSLFMTSLAYKYWHFLLAQGLGVGIGMGLMFSPSVGSLAHHFGGSRWKTAAYGAQASGSCLGGVLFPLLGRALFPRVGFGWTVRIFAFIGLAAATGAFLALSTTHPPRKELALLSPTVFKNRPYAIFVAGAAACSMTAYAPLVFAVTYGTSHGLTSAMGNTALAATNATSIIGRVLPLIVAQYVGPIDIASYFALSSSIMMFVWTRARGVGAVFAFDILYGISSGAYAAAFNAGSASFAPHPNQVGLYLGMAFFTTSFFWLAGTPITAALIRNDGTDYLAASMFGAAMVLLGAALLATSRFCRSRVVGSYWV